MITTCELYPTRFGDGNVEEILRTKECSIRLNFETDTTKQIVLLTIADAEKLIWSLQKSIDAKQKLDILWASGGKA